MFAQYLKCNFYVIVYSMFTWNFEKFLEPVNNKCRFCGKQVVGDCPVSAKHSLFWVPFPCINQNCTLLFAKTILARIYRFWYQILIGYTLDASARCPKILILNLYGFLYTPSVPLFKRSISLTEWQTNLLPFQECTDLSILGFEYDWFRFYYDQCLCLRLCPRICCSGDCVRFLSRSHAT
jgi:hypothetical protein